MDAVVYYYRAVKGSVQQREVLHVAAVDISAVLAVQPVVQVFALRVENLDDPVGVLPF